MLKCQCVASGHGVLLHHQNLDQGKLSTSLRDWLHVLQANGKRLMHKRVVTSEQGFDCQHQSCQPLLKGF